MSAPYYSDYGVTVYAGDSFDRGFDPPRGVLTELPDASVHAIVTDPPYELAFMGRRWDASGIAFDPAMWRECLRVLKPGGHLLAFGGSRTWHRLTCAVEDAGFEIRDSIAWLYACLTADTEILTATGWKPGIDVERGEKVAQWDPATGDITLAPALDTFRGPWDDAMRVLRNADTDQVLTPNHRVYHQPLHRKMPAGVRTAWYDNEWRVAEAGDLSTSNPTRLPIAGEHDGAGVGGDDYAALLGWVWTEGGFDLSGTGVRIYQSSVNAEKVDEIQALLGRLGAHKRYDRDRQWRGRAYVETTWYMSGELAKRVRDDLPGKRPTYALLWRMTASEKRSMLRAALLGDGSRDAHGTWQFYQQYEDDLVWLQTLLHLVGQAGKVGMRGDRPGGAVYVRDTATTELQARHLRRSQEHYTGEVWCVRVPTGAFVARRNGRVFITGNSGFPKSLDVSKAIDKAAGAEREVIGRKSGRDAYGYDPRKITHEPGGLFRWGDKSMTWEELPKLGQAYYTAAAEKKGEITAPASPAARRWQGWGTALKPAFEPIVVARKPLAGTVAGNVLEHGVGALNIDGCRVGTTTGDDYGRTSARADGTVSTSRSVYGADERGIPYEPHDSGRWPSNVVLTHAPDCEVCECGARGFHDATPDCRTDLDCLPGCPVRGLDEQTVGKRAAKGSKGSTRGGGGDIYGGGKGYIREDIGQQLTGYEDGGSAARFFPVFRFEAKAPAAERPRVDGVAHPTVKPIALMRWLVRLVTPPGGVVLDPFLGSGTTAQAARAEGFGCVGIEREATYLPLIRARLDGDGGPDLFGGAA